MKPKNGKGPENKGGAIEDVDKADTNGDDKGLEAETTASDDVADWPSDLGDSPELVTKSIPSDILAKYEIYSYRNAAVILAETHQPEFQDVLAALRSFQITTDFIRIAGGNESEMPKALSNSLRPKRWFETRIRADLVVKRTWSETVRHTKQGRPINKEFTTEVTRDRFLDGHKIDFVKGKVAFDIEWNSKDQTFDRDLYAFSTFFQCGVISAGILLTRSMSLNPVFSQLGPSLNKDGLPEYTKQGQPRKTISKYGASTTHMGKLLYRLNAGRNGGCPVLAIGITPACISDWPRQDSPKPHWPPHHSNNQP